MRGRSGRIRTRAEIAGAIGPWSLVSLVLLVVLAGFAGCTFGLGEYETSLDPAHGTDAGDGSLDDAANPSSSRDGASDDGDVDGAVVGGPCTSGQREPCTVPDGDGGSAGVCSGVHQCIQGAWGACVVEKKCPSTWGQNTPTHCKNTEPIGDTPAPRWTTNPAEGPDRYLYSVDRKIPFDTYGQNDKFCFVPKQMGNCYGTATPAISVNCTDNQLKLSGDDFVRGSARNIGYCIDHSGPSCAVIDKHTAPWTAGPIECERWFEQVAFVVEAEPRCAGW